MSIRDKVHDWLGISSTYACVDARIKKLEQIEQLISDKSLRLMIGEAIEDLIDGKPDGTIKYGWKGNVEVGSKFDERVKRFANDSASKTAHDVAECAIDRKINTEAFIDSVVERINKKRVVQ